MATVTVRGTGAATAQPDDVTVGLSVEALRPNATEAFAEATRLAADVVSLCDELGVPAGSRTTTQVSLAEHGEHTNAGWQHRGYRAATRVAAHVSDAELASRLVSEAAARLQVRIDGPTWRVAHDNPAHGEARRGAAEDARSRADEYAVALGGRVGAVVSVVEAGAIAPGPEPRMYAVRQEISPMPLEAGEHRRRRRGRRHVPAGAGVSRATVVVDRDRLVDTASRMVGTWSFTGSEQAMAELMRELYEEMGLRCQWQQVEDGRANALGIWEGAGGGKSLMFNGHMDTSYSGREPWLAGVPGFQPEAFVRDGRLYGLGISNMKGALACYLEAVRALQDSGVRLRGDVLIAAVSGEIEKTQQGDAVGAEYRGYAAGTRYLVSHGGVADMCLLGEPTEGKVVLGHFGALWLRIRVHGNFIHTAFSEGRRGENAILRQQEVLAAVMEWVPTWEDDPANGYRGAKAIVNVGAIEGGFGWRVSRTPHHADLFLDVRVPPTKPMAVARREVLDMVRGLADRFPEYGVEGEVYVTAPGAEIEEGHELVAAIDGVHEEIFGAPPGRDVTRWFSDASALTRYGVPTVNYGTSTGLMDVELGENLEIDGLVRTAEVYARVAMRVCGVV